MFGTKYTKKEILKNYRARFECLPEYYTEEVKRIIDDVDSTYIDVKNHENNLSFREVMSITREFLKDLNIEYLCLFDYLVSNNKIKTKGKNKRKLKKFGNHNCLNIEINYNDTDFLLHTLIHEIGHATTKREEGYLYLNSIYDEAPSHLFTFLFYDFLNERYPKIDLSKNMQKQFNITFSGFNKDNKKILDLIHKSKEEEFDSISEGIDIFEYESNITYLYSYYLAHILHEEYKSTKDLNKIKTMSYLIRSSLVENKDLLNEIGIEESKLGTKVMQKEIRKNLR